MVYHYGFKFLCEISKDAIPVNCDVINLNENEDVVRAAPTGDAPTTSK